jgi:hypothetical protein
MSLAPGTCCVCGGVARSDEPVVDDEYYPHVWSHGSCVNTPAGVAWRERQRGGDPGYARYLRLSTVGLTIECPACGLACIVSAKARGMGAGSWEACCTACSRVTRLSGYRHPREYDEIAAAERLFLLDAASDWRSRMVAIAGEADTKLDERTCACGSRFSVAAPPRCPGCRTVLLDSFFHHACARADAGQ